MPVLETLALRGLIQQCSAREALSERLSQSPIVFYVGFDPTADSFHVGNLVPIMAMMHLQREGHVPIAVLGGGTAQVGDPSGKTQIRPMLSVPEIAKNGEALQNQLQRYLPLDGTHGLFVNNADWLCGVDYLTFLRTVGRHFKVNEMIRVEAYRQRLERAEGLSFLEFNYQLLQAYDFLTLYRRWHCTLQMGGDDQWGNILAGIDLIRKVEGVTAYALTFPLLVTATGQKMGKTESGTLWLDARKTSPYDFYQYWINTDDRDVARFLAYFTLLPMQEIATLTAHGGADLKTAKAILAFEVTRLAHGLEAATRSQGASQAAFGHAQGDLSAMPTSTIARIRLQPGLSLVDLLCEAGLTVSRGAARRLISQGGAYVNGAPMIEVDTMITETYITDGILLLRYGKKRYHRIVVTS